MLDYHSTKFHSVIPLSGGIDSTAAAFISLKENPNKNYLIYRIQLLNGTSGHRTIREDLSTEKILNWFEQNGLTNFAFRKLSFDYSSLGMMPPIWDSDAVNFIASVVVQAHPEIDEFIEGAIANDFEDPGFQKRLDKIAKLFYLSAERSLDDFTFTFPVREKTKKELMELLPESLLRLTWSCRYPEIGAPYTFVRCHKCPQCKLIDELIIKYPNLKQKIGELEG